MPASFLPTSLVSSLIYFFLELYVVIRLALLIAPRFMQLRHRVGVMTDVRVLRGLSLMFMELLTIVPSVTFTSILGEFIPFSIGSLAVLCQFSLFIFLQVAILMCLLSTQPHSITSLLTWRIYA
jgi:hypothetical protein